MKKVTASQIQILQVVPLAANAVRMVPALQIVRLILHATTMEPAISAKVVPAMIVMVSRMAA